MKDTTRRNFLKSAVAASGVGVGLQAIGGPAVISARGANDKIRVGFIGVGNRGSQLLQGFLEHDDCEVAALCDVYEPYLQRDFSMIEERVHKGAGGRLPKLDEKIPRNVARYKDYRRLLEQKDIDAVCIGTPDHWHALQTIHACEAGKDVYVEKPLTVTVVEGRKMVEAAKRTNRVVQVGLHRRSNPLYRELGTLVPSGLVGEISVARAYRISNMYPYGIGVNPSTTPPTTLDWDMWLGPRPLRPYQDNIAPYKFRWWQNYSSQMGNWGVHYCDASRWVMNEQAPVSISAHGGQFIVKDDRTIPDTMEVIFEYASGALLIFGQYEASGGPAIHHNAEIEFRGTRGNIYTGSNGSFYKVMPTSPGQFADAKDINPVAEKEKQAELEYPNLSMNQNLTVMHIRNFLDCIKTREQCNCDLETGHRSTSFAHLANIALATKSRLDWDPVNERFLNNDQANALLHYEYRKPWSLE